MKVGDLVKMDFEGDETWSYGDVWGAGVVLTIERRGSGEDVEVLWAGGVLSWELKIMLDIINESR